MFANDLNSFFSRFESENGEIDKCVERFDLIKPTREDSITISEDEIRRTTQCLNSKKAPGPDRISPLTMKDVATELTPVWQPIFQHIVDNPHTIPPAWLTAYIKPLAKSQILKNTMITGL